MRMWHPDLPYTKKNGGVEVSEAQFEAAWNPKGWRRLLPPVVVTVDGEEG